MVTLKEGKIIDEWAILLEQCRGRRKAFRMVEDTLTEGPGLEAFCRIDRPRYRKNC